MPAADAGEGRRVVSAGEEMARAIAALPPVLRTLLDAELAAGNRIVELGHSFPAPPAGAFLRLERPISTRARASGDGLRFRERPGGGPYAAEFSDAQGHYFLLEPPGAPPPLPDMDAIRAAHAGTPRPAAPDVDGTLRRFARSMVIDYEKWHDGVGYDLALLDGASRAEREAIEALLLARTPNDWRDVEALARLDTAGSRIALERILAEGTPALQMAVLRHRRQPLAPAQRSAVLVRALEQADFYAGLTEALDEAVAFHPPVVLDALWRGLAEREGPVAVHFAATLSFLHGLGTSRFDWTLRPLFLRFHCERGAAREAAIAALKQQFARRASDK